MKEQIQTAIRCDSDGCTEQLVVLRDINEREAAVVAEAAMWSVKHGSKRDYHHCPVHRERDDVFPPDEVTK